MLCAAGPCHAHLAPCTPAFASRVVWCCVGCPLQLPGTLEILRTRSMEVRADRIRRVGADPRPDCCLKVDAPPSATVCARDLYDSPARITAELAEVPSPGGLTLQLPITPIYPSSSSAVSESDMELTLSPVRTRRSPFRSVAERSLPLPFGRHVWWLGSRRMKLPAAASGSGSLGTPVRATAAELRRQNSSTPSDVSMTPAPSPITSQVFTFTTSSTATGSDSPAGSYGVIVAEDLACSAPTRTVVPRREKSLGTLCQKFLSIFLLGRTCFCLDDAARLLMLPEEISGPGKLRTKIRRLYDIANVLCTLGLVEKVHTSSQKKPSFHWRGPMVAQQLMCVLLLFVRA